MRCTSGVAWGSSPRMRGAHDFFGCDIFDVGIIPAYAGSTRTRTSATGSPRDHPRVCGEHADGQAVAASATGSSPRMRGALLRDRVWPVGRGIIPAYAGSTTPALCVPMSLRDHPRVCGEHWYSTSQHRRYEGSSPRMRGALDHDCIISLV